MFLHVSVNHSVHRGVVSQHALQISRPTPRGEVEESGLGGGSPGPHPGGKLRGLAWGVSRPTPGGVCIPACTEADPPPQQMATAAGGTHPTGIHSCWDGSPYSVCELSPCPAM